MLTDADPIELLKKIADKIYAKQEKAENLEIEGKGWQGISFLCGNQGYMVSIKEVVEIIPYPKLIPIPGVSRWLKGVMNFRGDIL